MVTGLMGWLFLGIKTAVLAPIRFVLGVRESMTGASATLLLIAILSFNVIWGYPWLGTFAAASSMFVAGFVLNRVFRPKLRISFRLPAYAQVGKDFLSTVHLEQRSHLPAFDLHVHAAPTVSWQTSRKGPPIEIVQSGEPVWMINGRGAQDTLMLMRGNRRGVHRLPAVETVSMFPFSLFRSVRHYKVTDEIAVAPQPFAEGEDEGAEQMLSEVNQWTERWFAGESFDYVGNREYVVGMPVRQWDFRSWARLGRPIVREFQTPSRRVANLIVDTAEEDSSRTKSATTQEAIEWMLRYAVTTLERYHRGSVESQLFITGQQDDLKVQASGNRHDEMMIRLARAKQVDPKEADRLIGQAYEELGDQPTLLFTTRHLDPAQFSELRQLLVVRVDPNQLGTVTQSQADQEAVRLATQGAIA